MYNWLSHVLVHKMLSMALFIYPCPTNITISLCLVTHISREKRSYELCLCSLFIGAAWSFLLKKSLDISSKAQSGSFGLVWYSENSATIEVAISIFIEKRVLCRPTSLNKVTKPNQIRDTNVMTQFLFTMITFDNYIDRPTP